MFNEVKVFSATVGEERLRLGPKITHWLRSNKDLEIVSHEVRQSSDLGFHCLSFVFFCKR